jgi:hypothetical protein
VLKITLRLPSSKVTYGYTEIEGTAKEIAAIDFEALGADYVNSMAKYVEGEREAYRVNMITAANMEVATTPVPSPQVVMETVLERKLEKLDTPAAMIEEAFPKAKAVSTTDTPWDKPVAPGLVTEPWDTTATVTFVAPEAGVIPEFDFS